MDMLYSSLPEVNDTYDDVSVVSDICIRPKGRLQDKGEIHTLVAAGVQPKNIGSLTCSMKYKSTNISVFIFATGSVKLAMGIPDDINNSLTHAETSDVDNILDQHLLKIIKAICKLFDISYMNNSFKKHIVNGQINLRFEDNSIEHLIKYMKTKKPRFMKLMEPDFNGKGRRYTIKAYLSTKRNIALSRFGTGQTWGNKSATEVFQCFNKIL